jgi:YXWGXW repeat-containing protein
MMKNSPTLSGKPARRLPLLLTAAIMLSMAGGCVVYPGRAYVYGSPPPPRVEVIGMAPGPGYFWVRGHWAWRGGNYVWIGGHWSLRPGPGAAWIDGRWENRGGNYVYVEGYWR